MKILLIFLVSIWIRSNTADTMMDNIPFMEAQSSTNNNENRTTLTDSNNLFLNSKGFKLGFGIGISTGIFTSIVIGLLISCMCMCCNRQKQSYSNIKRNFDN